ncbi:hypothetical protein [Novosphingobium sp.]|uniref:hypothetical protein n=1 Tax=Novosphingobium sp. TaxID=1874826 RepID=UPI002FDD8843
MTIAPRMTAVAILTALALGGCMSKLAEGRVRSALVDAGLSDRNAACMAERMTDRLSIGQLRRLEALRAERRTLADYVYTVRRVGDRQLIEVTTSAALLCATGLAPEKR